MELAGGDVPAARCPGNSAGARRRGVALRLVPVVVPVAIFLPALLGSRLLAVGDGLHYDLPLYTLAAQAWHAGQVPAWNPYIFSGAPLLAIGQAGVFYPPNALFLVSTFWAYNALIIVHFALAGVGAAALARRFCRDDVGAAVAGVGFALCGFFFAHVAQANLEASAAWLPWTLLAFERLRDHFSAWRLAQAGAALGLGLVAGFLQMFAITLAMLVVYAATLAVLEGRRGRGRAAWLAAVVAVAGASLAGVQLLPTLSVLGETARAWADISFVTSDSLSWSHAPLLMFPYLFGNDYPHAPFTAGYGGQIDLHAVTGYPGMALLVVAVAGAGLARRDRRALALLPAAALALIAMLGDSTPAGQLIAELPIYGKFRAWARYVVVVDLVVAVLAGYGIAALRQADRETRRAAARRGLIAAAVIVGAALVIPRLPGIHGLVAPGTPGVLAIVIPAAAASLAAGGCLLARSRPGAASALLLALVIVDPLASFGGFFQWRDSGTIAAARQLYSSPHPAALRSLQTRTPGLDRYLVQGKFEGWTLLVNALQGFPSVNGKEQLRPNLYSEALGVTASGRIKRRSSLFRAQAHSADLLRASVIVRHTKDQAAVVRPRQPALPDAFVVGQVEQRSRRDILDAVDGRRPFDPSRVALVERCGEWCRPLRDAGRAGTVFRERRHMSSTSLEVHARRPGLLTLSQAWFPGWEARLDGRSAPVLRADGLVTGVPVPAGHHAVALRYHAPGLDAGAAVSLLAAMALLAWGVTSRVRRPG